MNDTATSRYTTPSIRPVRMAFAILLIAFAFAGCAGASATSATHRSKARGVTVLMVSLATVDRVRAISSALDQLDEATERRDHIIVIPIVGTAAGSPPVVLSEADPPDAKNDRRRDKLAEKWALALHREVEAALDEIPPSAYGTAADLAEFVEVGIRAAEAAAPGMPSDVIVVSSGHTALEWASRPIGIDRATSTNPADVWFVGVGDFAGVDQDVDPLVAERAIDRAAVICRELLERGCHVVSSFDTSAGDRS